MITFIISVLLTELLVELFIKSTIFKPIREAIIKFSGPLREWTSELLSCGYCFSVWAAFAVVFLLQPVYNLTGVYFLDLALVALVVHRLSNILHNVIDKWTDKYYDVRYINTEKD